MLQEIEADKFFNCGTTSERMKGDTISKELLCEACIIHENSYLSERPWKERVQSATPSQLTKNQQIFGEGGEGRSGYGILAEGGNEVERVSSTTGQAEKSARGMPWHQEPTKDVTSCDKPRLEANTQKGADFRMGQPAGRQPASRQA